MPSTELVLRGSPTPSTFALARTGFRKNGQVDDSRTVVMDAFLGTGAKNILLMAETLPKRA
jgi:hypothetical protein